MSHSVHKETPYCFARVVLMPGALRLRDDEGNGSAAGSAGSGG